MFPPLTARISGPCCWCCCPFASMYFASYNMMRRLCCERPRVGAASCRWEQALDLLMGIKTRGLTPDVVSFSSAMSACDRAGEWQVCKQKLQEGQTALARTPYSCFSDTFIAC